MVVGGSGERDAERAVKNDKGDSGVIIGRAEQPRKNKLHL